MNRFLGITVRDMLNMDIIKNSKVLAGASGLHNRITKINVMEVPDIVNWVNQGEFLLTTAYSIKDNIEKLREIILQFKGKGVAGVGIKMKRYIDEIPKDILDLADELDFPIIELPLELSYSEIITPVLTEIINSQTNILLKIDNFHTGLMNIMLKGGDLKEIAEAINHNVDNSVAIFESIFEGYVVVGQDNIQNHIKVNYARGSNKRSYIEKVRRNQSSYFMDKDNIGGKEIKKVIIPIVTKEKSYGYISIWEDKRPLSPVELKVIVSSTTIIALDLIKKLSVFEIENKYKIEFFDDLLSNDETRQKNALERASFFGFDTSLSYAVANIVIKDIDKVIRMTPNNSNYLHHINGKLLNIIERIAKFRTEKIISGNKSDRLIILFGSPKGDKEEAKKGIIQFCKEAGKHIGKELGHENISIGIGRSYENVSDIWKSHREASRSAGNLKKSQSHLPVHYDDLGIYRILCYEELQPELIQFYKEMISPLVKYDREKDADMIRTLQMYFRCGSNLKKMSEEMYTHYNTIIYRIQRIQEITGLNLDDPNDKLNAQISLKIYDILNENEY